MYEGSDTEHSRSVFLSTVEENSAFIKDAIVDYGDLSSRSTENPEEYSEEIENYLNNPELVYNDLIDTESGQDYIDYLVTISTTTSVDGILEAVRPLVNEEQYQEIVSHIPTLQEARQFAHSRGARGIDLDKQAHAFAGASAALITAAVVYVATPHFFVPAKIAAGAALGVAAGITAGALKELLDSWGYGTVDFMDWVYTAGGAAIGGVVAGGIASVSVAIGIGFDGAAIIIGTMGAVLGITALRMMGWI